MASLTASSRKNVPGEHLFVSVVMPVRNEAAFMDLSLRSVLAQDYPPDRLEVIVADGMSTDGTREVVRKFSSRHHNVRLVDNPGKIAPTAMNVALAQARGDVIVRVDGHCEIAADYVRRCVVHLREDDVDVVGGPLETVGETRVAQAIAAAMSSTFGVGNSAFRTMSKKTMLTDTVAFGAYKRSSIDRLGPFDEELVRNQDDEYNYRLRKLGGRILLAADVRSRYYSRSSLKSLWKQYFQYGYWKVRVMQKHHRQMRVRHFVPGVFVIALLASLLIAPFSGVGVWSLGLICFSYVTANLGASVVTALKAGWRLLPFLPAAFLALHFGYGMGFLTGLVKFAGRWGDMETRSANWHARLREEVHN